MDVIATATLLVLGVFVLWFGLLFLRFYARFKQEGIEELKKQIVLLSIESVTHNGNELFLLYEQREESKFIAQGQTVDEISKYIVANFTGKTVYLREEGNAQFVKLLTGMEKI